MGCARLPANVQTPPKPASNKSSGSATCVPADGVRLIWGNKAAREAHKRASAAAKRRSAAAKSGRRLSASEGIPAGTSPSKGGNGPKIIGDVPLELEFAKFLERCPDVDSYAKNYFAIGFKLDYIKANGDIANYYPDFIVRIADGLIVIVELKGRVDEDVHPKMDRLRQWCEECSRIQLDGKYDFVFVDDEGFRNFPPKTFGDVLSGFLKYK